jgi:hypothetical protein
MLLTGRIPLRWTTVCGHVGVVVFNKGICQDFPVCPDCEHPTMYHE